MKAKRYSLDVHITLTRITESFTDVPEGELVNDLLTEIGNIPLWVESRRGDLARFNVAATRIGDDQK